MPKDFEANYEDLDRIARIFGDSGDVIEQLDARLRSKLDQLRGGWQGTAADAFFDEMEAEVLPTVKRLGQALDDGNRTTHNIATVIRDAEEAAANVFRGGIGAAAGGIGAAAGGVGAAAAGVGAAAGGIGAAGTSVDPKTGKTTLGGFGKWSNVPTQEGQKIGGFVEHQSQFLEYGKYEISGENGSASFTVAEGTTKVRGEAAWDPKTGSGHLTGSASAKLELLKVQGNLEAGPLDIKAEAKVAAEIEAQAEVVFDPKNGNAYVEGKLGGVAGVTVEAEGSYETDLGTVKGKVGAIAGVAGEVKGDVGFKDGVFSISGEASAALGIGFSAGVDLEIDVGGVIETAEDVASFVDKGVDMIFDIF